MSINVEYRVVVTSSDETLDFYSTEYVIAQREAKVGCIGSGGTNHTYGAITEWALFDNLEEAVECEKKLKALLKINI